MNHLSVSHVDFAYPNGHAVFCDLSFQVQRGEFVALLGPSGCGKSTLLNLLSGFQQPDRGSLTVDGEFITPESPALGYVFQSPNLFPWLSALDNVRFGLRMTGSGNTIEQRERAHHYLSLVGLGGAADKLPHQLSGGMQQRVALARTLVMEPSLLLMDEPFAALDALSRQSMNEEILRFWSLLGQTVVFITHDIEEAVFLADRVLVLGTSPNGLQEEIRIDLPRPRSQRDTRKLQNFHDYCNTLRERIALMVP
ncbi:ABC transporter ATP-binding protein [Undibacterium sp. SXout7W]|uniref:ABC transporter ATP-binding protein n=1 Tax=Undibacterium sp. SXout7W TaxID=3413049 RepID=UPI003BF16BDB